MAYLHFADQEEPRAVLLDMLSLGELCDMSLVCQETGKTWRVHGIVMLAMTEDLLRHRDKKTEEQLATLTLPWSENTIEALIKTAYEGAEKVQLDVGQEDVLKDLVSAASSLNVLALKERIGMVPFLAQSLTDDLITFMAKNVEHIRITKAYVQLDVKDMEKLLRSRHLQLSRENAMAFLSVWAVASGPSLTRSNKISLERLANTPTCFRVPTTVVLATGGWSHEPTNLVEVWNPLTEQWMASDVKLPGCSRAYHGLEVLGSDIWAIGGYSQSGGFQRSTMKFSLSTGEWKEMSRMSTNRCYVSTNVLAGKIYALGGHAGGSAERLRSAEVYSPETNQWADISPMLYNRSDFASVVYRGKIFAIGGFHGFHYQSSFEAYDPESDSWTFEGNLQIARSGASAVVAGDKIFILGGFDGGERLASVECITPGLVNTVRHEVPPMLHRRSNFSALLLDPNTIMVVGGFRKDPEDVDGGEVSGEVELLDLVRNVWTVAPNLTVPRSALQAIKVENMYRSFV